MKTIGRIARDSFLLAFFSLIGVAVFTAPGFCAPMILFVGCEPHVFGVFALPLGAVLTVASIIGPVAMFGAVIFGSLFVIGTIITWIKNLFTTHEELIKVSTQEQATKSQTLGSMSVPLVSLVRRNIVFSVVCVLVLSGVVGAVFSQMHKKKALALLQTWDAAAIATLEEYVRDAEVQSLAECGPGTRMCSSMYPLPHRLAGKYIVFAPEVHIEFSSRFSYYLEDKDYLEADVMGWLSASSFNNEQEEADPKNGRDGYVVSRVFRPLRAIVQRPHPVNGSPDVYIVVEDTSGYRYTIRYMSESQVGTENEKTEAFSVDRSQYQLVENPREAVSTALES